VRVENVEEEWNAASFQHIFDYVFTLFTDLADATENKSVIESTGIVTSFEIQWSMFQSKKFNTFSGNLKWKNVTFSGFQEKFTGKKALAEMLKVR